MILEFVPRIIALNNANTGIISSLPVHIWKI